MDSPNILLVEDSDIDVEIINRATRDNFRVKVVHSISDIVDNLDSTDIVICDLSLLDSNPLETIEYIKGIRRSIPVLVYTSSFNEAQVSRLGYLGIPVYFKDSNMSSIVPMIYWALGQYKKRRQLLQTFQEVKATLERP